MVEGINIESRIYTCGVGPFNLGRWWTDPVPHPTDRDVYFFCGGNVEAGEKAGKGDNRCIELDLTVAKPNGVVSCAGFPTPQNMSITRQAVQPVCLTPAQCYFFGGYTGDNSEIARSVDRLDVLTRQVTRLSLQLPEPRLAYAAAALNGSEMLITGGYGVKDPVTQKGPVYDSAVRLDPSKGTVVTVPMKHKRGAHSITALPDGRFLLIGGNGDDPKGAEIFDPKTNAFTSVAGKMSFGRKDHRAVLVGQKVYVIGGSMGDVSPRDIEVFDVSKQSFSPNGLQLSEGREDLAVAYIPEKGIIVAVGGEIKGSKGEPESDAIDVIDLQEGRVISGKLQTPRDEPTMVIRDAGAQDGKVKLLVLTGQRKVDGKKEASLPMEEVTITYK